jgi:hypothetical protein
MDISRSDVLRAKDQIVDGLTAGERLRLSIDAERELAKTDLYYLTKKVLGYDKLNKFFHLRLCRKYQANIQESQFHLHPRKHYKTTIITIAGSIFQLVNNPNITICIICNNLKNSSDILKEAKTHFIANDKFKDLFPEHSVEKIKQAGTHDKFITPARTYVQERMPSIEAFSSDRAIVSRHYKILKFDDIVDDKNTTTSDLIRKTYDNYAASLATTSQTASGYPWFHMVGTRWDYSDPYERIMKEFLATGNKNLWITKARWKEVQANGTEATRYLFPEQFSKELLDQLERSMGSYMFSCLYLNSPVPEGTSALNPHKLQPIPASKVPKRLNKIVTVDPATSEDVKNGDPSCIGVFGMDEKSNIFILSVEILWKNPDDLIDRILDTVAAHGIRKLGVEAVSFMKWLSFYLEKAKKLRHMSFSIEPIKRSRHDKKGKGGRHERIIPYANNDKIFVVDDLDQMSYIRNEFRRYPHGQDDHFLDTLTDAIELIRPPSNPVNRSPGYRLPPRISRSRNPFQTGYSYRAAQFGGGR